MINLIILVFTIAVFYAGFYFGAKYKTLSNFIRATSAVVSDFFDKD